MTATTGLEVSFLPRDCYTATGQPKVAFPTKRDAKTAARRMPSRPGSYRCGYCGQWHHGNTTPRVAP